MSNISTVYAIIFIFKIVVVHTELCEMCKVCRYFELPWYLTSGDELVKGTDILSFYKINEKIEYLREKIYIARDQSAA